MYLALLLKFSFGDLWLVGMKLLAIFVFIATAVKVGLYGFKFNSLMPVRASCLNPLTIVESLLVCISIAFACASCIVFSLLSFNFGNIF